MEFDKYDIEGYSREEDIKKNENVYSLQQHEIKSLEEIQHAIEKGAGQQLEAYLSYLDHLELKVSTILITEEKEGLSNVPLRSDLSRIRRMKEQVLLLLKKTTLSLPVSS